MKKLRAGILILVLSGFVLSFTIPNNFTKVDIQSLQETNEPSRSNQHLDGHVDLLDPNSDTVSFVQVNQLVTTQMIDPIVTCFEKKDPHMFMSKCFTRVYFRLTHDQMNRRLYADNIIRGTIYLTDCSVESRLADVFIDFEKSAIQVKESYKTDAVDLKTFLSDICSFVEKNGIPNR